jgi:hypothetical protein
VKTDGYNDTLKYPFKINSLAEAFVTRHKAAQKLCLLGDRYV